MWFFSWYGKLPVEKRNRALIKSLLYFVAGAILVLVISGRIPILFAAVSALIPLFHRLVAYRGMLGMLGRFAGQKFGPTTLTTAWLIVEYDLAKRSLDGTVTQGQFQGKKLSQLSETELNILLEEVKEDFQSKAAVNAYILARQGRDQTQQNDRQTATASEITRTQAYEILGLEEGASNDEIKAAHRRLIQKLHPDRGGSSYLAAQINAAKDVLSERHV